MEFGIFGFDNAVAHATHNEAMLFGNHRRSAVVDIALAVGHHLPGFIRTYGDADLFRRYRVRFILAPILVFGCSLWFAKHDLHGVLLLSLVWAIWHGMMQHYGFMRIYDAKIGVIDSGHSSQLSGRTIASM